MGEEELEERLCSCLEAVELDYLLGRWAGCVRLCGAGGHAAGHTAQAVRHFVLQSAAQQNGAQVGGLMQFINGVEVWVWAGCPPVGAGWSVYVPP